MLQSWKIGRLFGIGIYIHWSFWILPIFIIWHSAGNSPFSVPLLMLLLAGVFFCVVLHEVGHALTARRFGIGTKDITLLPIGGVARLERMSEKPWEEFWIAVGGPAVNVVIASLLTIVALAVTVVDRALMFETTVGQMLLTLLGGNIVLVLFNMLPVFPMDGGRVFRSVLAMWMGQLGATRVAAIVGIPLAVLMALFGIQVGQPMLLVVAIFVYWAGQQELRYVEWRREQKRFEDPEPVEVIPVRRPYYQSPQNGYAEAPRANGALNSFIFQPKVSVYIWDNQAGMWIKQPESN